MSAFSPDRSVFPFTSPRQAVVLISLATVLAYLPALRGGFVFDDGIYVTENEKLRTWEGLPRLWTEPTAAAYHPLVMTTFWVEYQLWGYQPFGYHLNNLLLHLACSLWVGRLLTRLEAPGGALAAALFALHPVHVESVAWVTERKDVLSGLLFLLSLSAWLAFEAKRNVGSYLLVVLLFALSLLAKSSTCMFPVVVLLIAWWKRGRVTVLEALLTIPLFLIAALIGSVYWWVEYHVATPIGPAYEFSLLERCLIAGRALCFYLGKLAWPYPLMPIYPRWEIDARVWWQFLYPAGFIGLWVALLAARSRIGAGAVTGLSFFTVMLLPALGFISYSYQRFSFVGDHFQYLASIGPIAPASAAWVTGTARVEGRARNLSVAMMALACAVLAGATWRQCGIYRDNVTYWEYNVEQNPNSKFSYDHLGQCLFNYRRFEEAERVYRAGLERLPEEADLLFGLARVIAQEGRGEEAVQHLREAIRMEPTHAGAHRNLAIALAARGETEEAEAHFRAALEVNKKPAETWNDLGILLRGQGRFLEAVECFQEGLRADSKFAPLWFNLGLSLADLGRIPEADRAFERSLECSPEDSQRIRQAWAEIHHQEGCELRDGDRLEEALREFERAVELWPRSGDYRRDLQVTRESLKERTGPKN